MSEHPLDVLEKLTGEIIKRLSYLDKRRFKTMIEEADKLDNDIINPTCGCDVNHGLICFWHILKTYME